MTACGERFEVFYFEQVAPDLLLDANEGRFRRAGCARGAEPASTNGEQKGAHQLIRVRFGLGSPFARHTLESFQEPIEIGMMPKAQHPW